MNSQASQCSSSRRRRHYEAGSDEDGASQSTQSQARTGLSKEELDRKVCHVVLSFSSRCGQASIKENTPPTLSRGRSLLLKISY